MKLITVKKGKAKYLVASLGSCSVKIYSTERDIGAATYEEHCVAFSEAGKRVRRRFSDLADAKTEAERVLLAMVNGETKALTLTNAEAQEYALAMAEIKPIEAQLLQTAREYRAAIELLKGKATLSEAIRYYMASGVPEVVRKTMPEAVAELLAAKERDGRSKVHLRDLGYRLKRFATKFPGQISEVSKPQIADWLRSLDLSPRGRNNYANAIANLFRWARDETGYLPEGRQTAGEKLPQAGDGTGEGEDVVIHKPAEVRLILKRLAGVRPELVPFVAIAAFAGLRTAEIQRLDWAEVDFEQGHIEVKRRNAKTRARRLVPILPNLGKWLAPHKGKTGLVAPYIRTQHLIQREVERLPADKAGPRIDWKRNAMRHSFGSYRLAITKSEQTVALEMGNSPAMLYANYRGITTDAKAAEYFAIEPEGDAA